MTDKSVVRTIRMPEAMITDLELMAMKDGTNFSILLRQLARKEIKRREKKKRTKNI